MAAGGEPAPGGAPASSPQAPLGDEASADAQVQVAMGILERALVKYRAHSSRGKALLKMLQAGAKEFGRTEEHAQRILPAELKSALIGDQSAGAPPASGGPPGAGPGAPPAPPMAGGGLPPGGPPPG